MIKIARPTCLQPMGLVTAWRRTRITVMKECNMRDYIRRERAGSIREALREEAQEDPFAVRTHRFIYSNRKTWPSACPVWSFEAAQS